MKKDYTSKVVGKVILLFLFCIFLFSSKIFAQLNGTYTIGTNGTEDYTSFTDAVTALTTSGISGSVFFNVSDGDYNEQISIPEITGASETNTIVFQSASGDTTDVKLYFEPTGTADNYTVKLDGADFINFRNLTITSEGVTDYGNVVRMSNDVKYVQFYGNQFIGKASTTGSFTDKFIIISEFDSYDTSLVFNGNTLHSANGIMYMLRQTNMEFINNTVYNATNALDILIGYSDNCVLDNNYIDADIQISNLNGTKSNHDIKRNVIIGELEFSHLAITPGQEIKVINNFIQGNLIVYTSSLIDIFNNTLVGDGGYVLRITTGSSNISVLNNIIKTKSVNACIELEDIDMVDYLDFNNLFSTSTNIGRLADVNYTSLAAWQTATSLEEHSINQSLTFVDEDNNDFHITPGEPDVYGVKLQDVKFDIDENIRYKSPNIGADEYTIRPLSGSYTIGTLGIDTFPSFTEAIEVLKFNGVSDHTTFNVKSGTYIEQLIIPEITGAGESAYVTFQSATENTEAVILTYTAEPSYNFVVKLDGADYIYLHKLTFQKGTDAAYGGRLLQLDNGANHNTIADCNFIGYETGSTVNSHALIYSQFDNSVDEYNVIANNTFTNGSMGIYFSGTYNSGSPIYEKDNEIFSNVFSEQYIAAISLAYQNSCIIRNDSIYTTSTATTPYGIYLNECKKEQIYLNTISRYSTEGDGSYGIYLEDCPGSVIDYGMIYNNFIRLYSTGAINTLGITLRNAPNRNIYFNTVQIYGSNNGSQVLKVWDSDWYNAKNNIFSNQAGGYAIYSDISSNFNSDYNDIYTTGVVLAQHYSTSCATLSEYQSTTSKDGNSLSVDPQFISETNLHIYHANTDLNNAGTPIALVTRDIDNELRDASNPDIGADEYDFVNNQNDFLSYSFPEQTGAAIINAENHTISIEVDYGTNLTSLVATFSISESASVKIESTDQVSGVTVNDFSSPVTYTITAEDDTEQTWTVTVTNALNDENDILTFSFVEQTGVATISAINHTVNIEVEFGTNLTGLIATFTLSPEATAQIGVTEQVSGVTSNNFSEDVVYSIYAEDGTVQDWTVTVTIAQNTGNEILTFSFVEQNDDAIINSTNHTVQVELVPGSSLTELVATFTLSENAQAYVDEILQTSGTTANDFSTIVVYNVIAEDYSEQEWSVHVTVEPYHDVDILTFSFVEQTGDAVINTENHTVNIEVTEGTSLINLVATFTLSEGATTKVDGIFQTSGTSENDFTEVVTYVVVAEDYINEMEWNVNVTVEDNSTGIENVENSEFKIFPNPATNYIQIKSNLVQNDLVNLEIIDVTGKIKFLKQIYLNNDLNITLYFDDEITSGIYFLRVKTDSRTITQRFIVK